MMSRYYVLDGREPVETCSARSWSEWMEAKPDRRVARSEVGDIAISTVFLGLDHACDDCGPPQIFETCWFNTPDTDDHIERYATWAEAEAGHARAVERARALEASK